MTRFVGVGAKAVLAAGAAVSLLGVGVVSAPRALGDVRSALPVADQLVSLPIVETALLSNAASDAANAARSVAQRPIAVGFIEPAPDPTVPAPDPTVLAPDPTVLAPDPTVPVPPESEPPPPRRKAAPTPESLPPAVPPLDLATAPPLGWGDEGDAVTLLQTRLVELGFMRAERLDGHFGGATWSAVLGFQKFESIERTGLMNPETWLRLYAPTGMMPLSRPGDFRSVEVDLERQVVFVMNGESEARITILNTSTGGNFEYTDPRSGRRDLAYTPTGDYNIYQTYDGLQKAPLGQLYRPLYFIGGWAIHGSTSVPAYPASHGCVRLSYDDMDWIWTIAPPQMEVVVHETMNRDVLIAKDHLKVSQPFLDAATPDSLAAA